MGTMAVIGYAFTLGPAVNRQPKDMTWLRWLFMAGGLVLFFGSIYIGLLWQPESTFHCTQHCFPWGQ